MRIEKKNTIAVLTVWFVYCGSSLTSGCSTDDDPFGPVMNHFQPQADNSGPGVLCPVSAPDLFNNSHSPYFGGTESVDLDVVTVAYFGCPHCAHFAETSAALWASRPEFNKRVRMFFHHYPFDNQPAWETHGATVAAWNQGQEAFWEMHDLVFEGLIGSPQKLYSQSELADYAETTLGLDRSRFDEEMGSPDTYGFLDWDRDQSIDIGVTGTPSVYICGEKIDRSQIEQIIDDYLVESVSCR